MSALLYIDNKFPRSADTHAHDTIRCGTASTTKPGCVHGKRLCGTQPPSRGGDSETRASVYGGGNEPATHTPSRYRYCGVGME